MKELKGKLTVGALCFCVSLATIGGVISTRVVAENAQQPLSEYAVVFDIHQIENYDASIHSVLSPNGESVEVDENGYFLLEELGTYEILKDGAISYYVNTKTYDVVSKAESLFSSSYITHVKANADWSDLNPNTQMGLEVGMKGTGMSFWYQNIVDLNELTLYDELFSAFVERSERSSMNDLKISLIDINDPTNVLSVTYKQNTDLDNCTYVTVQWDTYSCALPNDGGIGVRELGAVNMHTSLNLNKNVNADGSNKALYPLAFSYDCVENAVYMPNIYKKGEMIMLLDLDDSSMIPGKRPFEGFSDNKVYMKVETTARTSACLLLQKIAGIETTALEELTVKNDKFLRTYYDGGFYANDVLNEGCAGVVYSLPKIYYDYKFDESIAVSEKLLYLNDGKWQDLTSSMVDGKFTPDASGWYKVVYEAVGTKVGKVNKELFFEVTDSMTPIAIENENVSAPIMSNFTPPEVIVSGGSGKLHSSVAYKYNDVAVELDANGSLVLNQAGAVEMRISAVDFLGQTASKTITIDVIERPVVVIDEVPNSLYAGQEYVLSDFSAINYLLDTTDDGYNMTKTIRVNGVEIAEDRKFTPQAGETSVTIEYIGGLGTEYETMEEVTIPVLTISETDFFPISDYFIRDGVDMTLFDAGIRCDFTGDASFALPNAVPTDNFNLAFAFIDRADTEEHTGEYYKHTYYRNFRKLEVVFEDYYDASKLVTLTIENFHYVWLNDTGSTQGRLKLTLNGVHTGSISYSRAQYDATSTYAGVRYYPLSINMQSKDRVIGNGAGKIIKEIEYYDDGRIFEGFTNNLARVSMRFKSVSEGQDCSMIIQSFGNQALNEYALMDGDAQAPIISLIGRIPTPSYEEMATIPTAQAWDFFGGKSQVTKLTMTRPDGTQQMLDASTHNDINFDQYGSWKFVYEARDYAGCRGTYTLTVSVTDVQKPTISEFNAGETTYEVGEVFVVPTYTTRDNVSIVSEQIFLRDPLSAMRLVTGDYVFDYAGTYTVYIRVLDKEGNMTVEQYAITVEEASV